MFTYINPLDLFLVIAVIALFMVLVYKAGVDNGRRREIENRRIPQENI
jgi:hypothetical protein